MLDSIRKIFKRDGGVPKPHTLPPYAYNDLFYIHDKDIDWENVYNAIDWEAVSNTMHELVKKEYGDNLPTIKVTLSDETFELFRDREDLAKLYRELNANAIKQSKEK